MHQLFYATLKAYVTLGLYLFFDKIKIHGLQNIPKNDPVLFLPNHQNALIDALMIVTNNPLKTHFVARADVFKNQTIKKLLSLIYMRPIYRMRDGRSSLKLNEEIFDWCSQVLLKNDALVIFPEGNHSLLRKVRPLSKGFTRVVYGTLAKNPDLNLKIIPVGLNYTHHKKKGGDVSVYYGAPIGAKKYLSLEERQRITQLKEAVSASLKKLTTHIPEEGYQQRLISLERQGINFWDPEEANTAINEGLQVRKHKRKSWLRALKWVINFPIIINSILPILAWQVLKQTIKDPVMTATVKFSYGLIAYPICYGIQAIAISFIGSSWHGLAYFGISILSLKLFKD